jgi:hypothetical protein
MQVNDGVMCSEKPVNTYTLAGQEEVLSFQFAENVKKLFKEADKLLSEFVVVGNVWCTLTEARLRCKYATIYQVSGIVIETCTHSDRLLHPQEVR